MRYKIIPSLLLMVILLTGCSAGGMAGSPVIPDNNLTQTPLIPGEGNAPRENEDTSINTRVPLGLFSFVADPDKGTLEIETLRMVDFHLNTIPMLETDTQQLVTISGQPHFSSGGKKLDVNIKVTHPSTDFLFTGFDVHGILISKGSLTGWNDPDIKIAGTDETRLLYADGLTRWWNPAEFKFEGLYGYTPGKMGSIIPGVQAATLNGYNTFAYGLDENSTMADLYDGNRGYLLPGTSCTRHYTIHLGGGLQFNYAVDASWAFPLENPPIPPDDFPLKANMPEAYWINAGAWTNTLWWEEGVGHGGNAFYYITIHDWQGASTIGPARIEIPALGVNSILEDLVETGELYKRYSFKIILPELVSADALDVLVSVDSLNGDYQPGATGVNKPLRAYQLSVTPVSNNDPGGNYPPVSVMDAVGPTNILVSQSVTFDASPSYDVDGLIVDYTWDFNGDAIYGDTWDSGTMENPTKFFNQYGTFNVKCRVEDNEGAQTESPPVVVHATYEQNQPPVAIAVPTSPTEITYGMQVTFDASGSYDIDGSIVTYEWDFNGDGTYGDAYDSGDDIHPGKIYTEKGQFNVELRVVDDAASDDVLDEKILVTVNNSPPIAVAKLLENPPYHIGIEYHLSASSSSDIDGTIVLYEWDINYDGVTFNPTGYGEELPVTWNSTGQFDIMLHVVDDDGLEDFLDAPLSITVFDQPNIDNIKVTYEDPAKVTWTITGQGFTNTTGSIITDMPSGWTPQIQSWTDGEISAKFAPYTEDITTSILTAGGVESNQHIVREADGILVIYNVNSAVSGQIKDYYVSPDTGRGIPPEHVMPLDAPDAEVISRAQYDEMKSSIEDWLVGTGVRYEVKYIVTCKGVPLKVNIVNGSGLTADFAAVDSELNLLFDTYDILGRLNNAYYRWTAPAVFHPGKFTSGGLTVRYLTCTLAAYTYDETTAMIDRCLNPYTGTDVWHLLDGDPDIWYDWMDSAYSLMQAAGLNVYYDDTNTFATAGSIGDLSISDHVMTYTGHGVHHSPGPPSGEWYILNDLGFSYPNGALFNSYESFNGYSFEFANHPGQGNVADFIRMGGSGAIGHVYEPYSDAVGDERVLGRWYERGYNLIETQWMACRYVSWTEVVVGEPLCRIRDWEG